MSTPEKKPACSPHIQTLRTALNDVKAPFCSGTFELDKANLLLFYGNAQGTTGRIDFANASDTELEHLAKACDPATFGLNKEDVLDESYRKAGKLDERHFATKLDLDSTGLMDVVRFGLLEGSKGARPFRAELYNLNVYDKGAFFKAHKDTPRAETMFGSLVIVFPTAHEGGSLLLRHEGKEWTVDTGRLSTVKRDDNPEQPHIVFATFFSDVEHEVTPVLSGYRVTLTYNLYFDSTIELVKAVEHPVEVTGKTIPPESDIFKTALSNLIQDEGFLPEGGSLGFGLYHQYPVDKTSKNIRKLSKFLKGRDAMIMQACKELSLDAKVWLLYDDGNRDRYQFLTKWALEIDGFSNEETSFPEYVRDFYGSSVRQVERPKEEQDDYDNESDFESEDEDRFVWVRGISDLNKITEQYAAYGNHYYLGCVYANACLVVDIGPPGKRGVTKDESESESESESECGESGNDSGG